MAEVGMFQGASAKLICTAKGEATFWGFDTFEGLSDVTAADTYSGVSFFRSGQYAARQADVEAYLAEFENVRVVPGYFPESYEQATEGAGAGESARRRYSFVHLDVDTHDSTLASLRYFWSRMTPGGVVLIHDSHADGVRKAIDTFSAKSAARSFSTTGSQHAYLADA